MGMPSHCFSPVGLQPKILIDFRRSRQKQHNILKEISELAGHLKIIDRQEVSSSLTMGLKQLKSLIEMLIHE